MRKPRKTTARKPRKKAATAPAPAPAPEAPKRKRGRPSKYDPAFCDVVIDLGEQGKSRTQIARTLGTTRQRLLDWEEAHPEFRDALKVSSDLCQAWWEDQGQRGLAMGKDFNATAFIFQMKNRFRADYCEKVEVKHDGAVAFNNIWQIIGSGKIEGAKL